MADKTPLRDENGKLTRAGMEAVLKEGGSVQLSDGRTVTKTEELPTAAELAKGDPKAEREVEGELKAQMKALQAQLDELKAKPPVGTPPVVPPSPAS